MDDVAPPIVTADPTCLKEDGLFNLLAVPTQTPIEVPSSRHVSDAQRNQADPLLHA